METKTAAIESGQRKMVQQWQVKLQEKLEEQKSLQDTWTYFDDIE